MAQAQDWLTAAGITGARPVSSTPPARESQPTTDWLTQSGISGARPVERPDFSSTNATDDQGRSLVRGDHPHARVARAAGDFLGEALSSLNPVKINEAVQQAFWHPIDTAKGMLSAQDQLRKDGQEAFAKGDHATGTAKMMYWLLPIIGPRLSEAGDMLQQGQTAKGLGAVADVGLQMALPSVASKARVHIKPLAKAPNPAEAAAVEFGLREGIPVDAGTATGNRFVKGTQRLADESALGSITAERAGRAQAEALTATGKRLADRASASPITAEQTGVSVREALDKRIADLDAAADTHYGALRQAEAQSQAQSVAPYAGAPFEPMKMAVDVRDVKTAMQPIYKQLAREAELVPLQGGKAKILTTLDTLLNGPDFAPLSVADKALSDLKSMARGADLPALRTREQGISAKAVRELEARVRATAAAEGPHVEQALLAGRAATREKYLIADVRDDLLRGTGDEPVRLTKKLIAKDDTAIAKLKALANVAPQELPKIGRAYLDDLLETATADGGFSKAQTILSDWQKLGAETKRLLFRDPDYIRDLDSFFLLAKKIGENPNPSGTALTLIKSGEVGLLFTNPALGVPVTIGSGLLSKMLHSPRVVKALVRGVSSARSGPAGASAAAVTNLIREAREAGLPLQPAPAMGEKDREQARATRPTNPVAQARRPEMTQATRTLEQALSKPESLKRGHPAWVEAVGRSVETAVDVLSGMIGIGPDNRASMLGELIAAGVPVIGGAKNAKALMLKGFHGSPRADLKTLAANPPVRQFDNATSQFGVFVAPTRAGAERYAGKAGRIYAADVELKNPYDMPWDEFARYQDPTRRTSFDADGVATHTKIPQSDLAKRAEELKAEAAAHRQRLEQQGHDGVVIRDRHGNILEVASFQDVTPAKTIRAFHGSPHDFDKFDLSKIGTGEGAQAYGHGLYFAENADVATEYRRALSPSAVKTVEGIAYDSTNPRHLAASLLDTYQRAGKPDPRATVLAELRSDVKNVSLTDDRRQVYRQTIELLESNEPLPALTRKEGGRTYEVEIKADPDDLLDWDKPLSEQSRKVQNIARETAAAKLNQLTYEQWTRQPAAFRQRMMAEAGEEAIQKELAKMGTGESVYRHAAQASENSSEAAAALKRRGIPGIKYLDQGSRRMASVQQLGDKGNWFIQGSMTPYPTRRAAEAAAEAAGNVTRNFVIFDDSLIDILKKYGIVGAISSGALAEALARRAQPTETRTTHPAPRPQ